MTREVKEYGFNGLAGCVTQKKNRRTGSTIGVYHADQAGIDGDEASPWATVCETHNQFVTHPSLKLAIDHSAVPDEWCSECKAKQD
jgi:hypothetical protein